MIALEIRSENWKSVQLIRNLASKLLLKQFFVLVLLREMLVTFYLFQLPSYFLLFWWHSVLIQVHISASECLLEIFKLYRQISSVYSSNIGIKGELVHQCEMEKNMEAKSLLKMCIDILENLEVKNVQATWFTISSWNCLLRLHVNLKLLDVEYYVQENYFRG